MSNDTPPDWMTDEWFAKNRGVTNTTTALIDEILRLRAEVATLTAEKAKLLEHSDHDAAEILRLGGELDRANKDLSTFTVSEGYGYSDGKGTMVVDATPPADLHQSGPRVKLPTRFWELLDEINMTGDQRMSRALSMLGVTIESMDVRSIAAERAGGA